MSRKNITFNDKKYNIMNNIMKINFESSPVYGDDDKYIKRKIKIYADSIITNFHNKKKHHANFYQ